MWAFRTRPDKASDKQQTELEELFNEIPSLEFVYYFRWDITDIFDTAKDRDEAAERFEEFRRLLDEDSDKEFLEFFNTYDSHRDSILAYFDERKTSGVVEGINNKARVITKRCYGVKKVGTLFNHLCLNLNLAAQATGRTVQQMGELVDLIRTKFLGYYT